MVNWQNGQLGKWSTGKMVNWQNGHLGKGSIVKVVPWQSLPSKLCTHVSANWQNCLMENLSTCTEDSRRSYLATLSHGMMSHGKEPPGKLWHGKLTPWQLATHKEANIDYTTKTVKLCSNLKRLSVISSDPSFKERDICDDTTLQVATDPGWVTYITDLCRE